MLTSLAVTLKWEHSDVEQHKLYPFKLYGARVDNKRFDSFEIHGTIDSQAKIAWILNCVLSKMSCKYLNRQNGNLY